MALCAGRISKIDITAATPTATDVVTGLDAPGGLVIIGNDLYIAESGAADKISKINIPILSINNYSTTSPIKVHPNPSNNFITINGLIKKENYKIYNTIGSEIDTGSIINNDKIDIRYLTNGIYFLKFANGNTIKFIKE